jgi:Ser/Thr protein kinase RdoA (MazF antagonist)
VVRALPSSPRSHVWLVEFDGAPAVVKQIGGGLDAAERYAREVTALRLAGRASHPVVPGLLAADPGARVLVLEYLAEREPLEEWLTGPGPTGDWLIGYASALARLHAATGPADAGALPAWAGPARADARAFMDLAARLRVPVPPGLPGELDGLLGRLDPAGQYALLHGDPCPGNVMATGGGFRFIDLEGAAFGAGYTELAYLRAGFPPAGAPSRCPGPCAPGPRPPTTPRGAP